MRCVVQRCTRAQVSVDGEVIGRIGHGFMVLCGVEQGDGPADMEYCRAKLAGLRVFEDDQGKLNRSLLDIGGEMLVVSNFTLGADCKKGTRPSFSDAAAPSAAVPLYELFVEECRKLGVSVVKTGEFGADMKVSLVNDGPVTIILDSDRLTQPKN